MCKKKKKKNKGYSRVGSVLGVDTTILQAATLLDEAALVALESKDTATSLAIARQWMELGAMMHVVLGGDEEEDHKHKDEDEEDLGSSILGFGNTQAREKAEAVARAKKDRS